MMARAVCVWMAVIAACAAAQRSTAYPPGWNGVARKPPMGWRSWNAFGNRINQDQMVLAAEALAAKNRTVAHRSNKVSLCELGYCSVGVDEGWEGCGLGVNGTQHAADGTPVIAQTFPDTGAMVARIHALGLAAGWYLNGCKCGERTEIAANYAGDIRSLHAFGFDSVKIDGCGAQRNQTHYAELMAATGRGFTIENCHWGQCSETDASSCPTADWCPFNFFRSSGDIDASAEKWLTNLQTVIPFTDHAAPLSRPGCWAYPDMLEVGRVAAPAPGAAFTWNRAHFGAWCIVSAPLILGLELSDAALAPILDVVGNVEAIDVNQQWAGHPGMLVEEIHAPPVPYDPAGATTPSSSAADFLVSRGASVGAGRRDAATSGVANIRSGNPGDVSRVTIGTGFVGGHGHRLDSARLSFRYSTGYTPQPGDPREAPTVRVILVDAEQAEVACIGAFANLGNYSWDHFEGYSPPLVAHASGLGLPNESPLALALEVHNAQRNLQIPVDDLADGFGVRVTWTASDHDEPPAPRAAPAVHVETRANRLAAPPAPPAAGSAARVRRGAAAPSYSDRAWSPRLFGVGQLWAKRQPAGAAAALLINHSPKPLSYVLRPAILNLTAGATYAVRDIWARVDLGSYVDSVPLHVAPYDSAFVLLAPADDVEADDARRAERHAS